MQNNEDIIVVGHCMLSRLFIFILFSGYLSWSQVLERPPQFVLISFDGSKSQTFWNETFLLSQKSGAQFSYFISGVYFLQSKDRLNYHPPQKRAGSSDIGFAIDDINDIEARTKNVWRALNETNPAMEIGSHVNGHFDGTAWTYEDWTQEFNEFYRLVGKVFEFYPTMNTSFKADWERVITSTIKGFRAPLLAGRPSITAAVMKAFRYSYDAGLVRKEKWPFKQTPELWNLGLSQIELAGTNRETIAMDYNILYGQCHGQFNPKNSGECRDLDSSLLEYFEKQTYSSYVQAFLKSYYGNRTPLSIGHHFSLWNKGIYWTALQRFVLDVCSLPEVKCVTHIELVNWLESQSVRWGSSFLTKMNQGLFSKTAMPTAPKIALSAELTPQSNPNQFYEEIVMPTISKSVERVMLKGDLPQAHKEISNDVDMVKYRISK